ncbi:MAG: hypothetical protein LUQ25_07745 [Methanoregulaceae archaeon]|nr:hypothetical protein [Methanoregulaceae archaeon]
MTPLEAVLVILLVAVGLVAIYYFFRGAKGDISLTSPVESRVDEYLDRRFESLVTEWALVRTPQVNRFKEEHESELAKNEAIVSDLNGFEREISATLNRLEERLDALEKELVETGQS